MAGLPMGGGKAVILRDDDGKGEARLEAFGRIIESLGGRYVTAEDVGMTDEDMRVIARRTRHVSGLPVAEGAAGGNRSEEHTSELQSLMRISYAVFCLKKKTDKTTRAKLSYT